MNLLDQFDFIFIEVKIVQEIRLLLFIRLRLFVFFQVFWYDVLLYVLVHFLLRAGEEQCFLNEDRLCFVNPVDFGF